MGKIDGARVVLFTGMPDSVGMLTKVSWRCSESHRALRGFRPFNRLQPIFDQTDPVFRPFNRIQPSSTVWEANCPTDQIDLRLCPWNIMDQRLGLHGIGHGTAVGEARLISGRGTSGSGEQML